MDHSESNTTYLVHGRHGTQTLRGFGDVNPEFELHGQLDSSILATNQFTGKVRTLTRDPWEKFQSGLGWYLSRLAQVGRSPDLPALVHPTKWDKVDYDKTKEQIRIMVASCVNASSINLRSLQSRLPKNQVISMIGNTPLWNKFNNFFSESPNRHFTYHLGESHLEFSNLSLVILVAFGLDIEVLDVTNIQRWIFDEFGFKPTNTDNHGKYVMADLKKQYYSDISEIYLDVLDDISQDKWFGRMGHLTSAEFKELMDLEYRAYNALNSDNVAEECNKFLLDLTRGLLNKDSQIELKYLVQCLSSMVLISVIVNQIPYRSQFYPVICFILDLIGQSSPTPWFKLLEDCEKLINTPYS